MMDLALEVLAGAFLIAGSFFCITGAIGLLRLPDFFSRSHGAGVLDGTGAALVLLGLGLHAGASLVAVKLLLVLIFMIITGPTAVHALARAALYGGLRPKLYKGDQEPAKEKTPSTP